MPHHNSRPVQCAPCPLRASVVPPFTQTSLSIGPAPLVSTAEAWATSRTDPGDDTKVRCPLQAGQGVLSRRIVLATDMPNVPIGIELLEQVWEVQLSNARFMPAGRVRYLHVEEPAALASLHDAGAHVALSDLNMVEVQLKAHVRPIDLLQQLQHCITVVEQVPWHISGVQGLHTESHTALLSTPRRPLQPPNKSGLLCALLAQSRHHVHQRTLHGGSIAQSSVNGLLKCSVGCALARKCTDPPLPGPITRWSIDQHLLQAMGLKLFAQCLGRGVIREQTFDSLEAGFCSSAKSLDKWMLREEH
mmetsp:Transcript_20015/g.69459  ORF Transcript_20015/g.69459 Transcript_20015/m.69459 type:complete len:304 (+) Transcript_20015:316-1227(+)